MARVARMLPECCRNAAGMLPAGTLPEHCRSIAGALPERFRNARRCILLQCSSKCPAPSGKTGKIARQPNLKFPGSVDRGLSLWR